MIYVFSHPGGTQALFFIKQIFPPPSMIYGFWAAAFACAIAVCSVLRLPKTAALAAGVLLFTASYILTTNYQDETFINFEHAWNLAHHGLLSFSPNQRILGTVEPAACMVLALFAQTPGTLVGASYGMGFLLGIGHLSLFYFLFRSSKPVLNVLFLVMFSVFIPWVSVFSSGYGNALVSFFYLLSVYLYFRGSEALAFWINAILPLLRADAVLFAVIFLTSVFLSRRKFVLWPCLAVLASSAAYFLLIHAYYGVWIPNPVRFKSFHFSMLSILTASDIKRLIYDWAHPFRFMAATALLTGFFFKKKDETVRFIYFSILPLACLYVFYSLSSTSEWRWSSRYYVIFEWSLLLLAALVFKDLLEKGWEACQRRLTPLGERFFRAGLLAFVFAITGCYFVLADDHSQYYGELERVNDLGVGGQLARDIVPKGWRVAATELNTFGYMNDFEIIDLWGFTNSQIASSKILSARRMRNDPLYFLQESPEALWYRTWGHQARPDLEAVPEKTLSGWNFSKEWNFAGDMHEVLKAYDCFILNYAHWKSYFLIRKDKSGEFAESLGRSGYAQTSARPLDEAAFRGYYDSQPLKQYRIA